jgi:MEDS: MEthanogen/methylotroph, DcmR Sensory domain
MTIDLALTPSLDAGSCPHLAVLLRTEDELYPTLASFYALGAKRQGYLVHRCVQGQRDQDRRRLQAEGVDVEQLEREERFSIVELGAGEAPQTSPERFQAVLRQALSRGCSAMWYARFAVGPDNELARRVVPYEQAWDDTFAGQPVVTLCPYIVGALDGSSTLEQLRGVSRTHSGVLISGGDGALTLLTTSGET